MTNIIDLHTGLPLKAASLHEPQDEPQVPPQPLVIRVHLDVPPPAPQSANAAPAILWFVGCAVVSFLVVTALIGG